MGCFGHADVETDDFYSVLKQERCQMRCSGPPYAETGAFYSLFWKMVQVAGFILQGRVCQNSVYAWRLFLPWRSCKRVENAGFRSPPTGGNITAWVIFDGDSGWPTCVFSGTPKWVWPKMVIHGLQCDPQFRGFDLEVVPTRTQRTNSCTQIQIHGLWCHDTPFGRHWKHFDIYP